MSNGRFAIFGREKGVILPRLDPIGPERRIDPNAPLVPAFLAGRPVVLARPDPLTRRPGEPVDLTVPITISRLRRGLDIERGRTGMDFMASAIDDWPLTHVPMVYDYSGVGSSSQTSHTAEWGLYLGVYLSVTAAIGAGIAVLLRKPAWKGVIVGPIAGVAIGVLEAAVVRGLKT